MTISQISDANRFILLLSYKLKYKGIDVLCLLGQPTYSMDTVEIYK